MSWTYRHRKALVMGTIALSLALLIAAALYMLMQHTDQQQKQQHMKEDYERQIQQLKSEEQQNSRNVWMTTKTIRRELCSKWMISKLFRCGQPSSARRHHRPGKHHRQKCQNRACAGNAAAILAVVRGTADSERFAHPRISGHSTSF